MNINEVTLDSAKRYYKLEMIKSFRAVRNPLNKTAWLLEMDSKRTMTWVMTKSAGGIKEYVSLDALVRDVERIAGDVKEFRVV